MAEGPFRNPLLYVVAAGGAPEGSATAGFPAAELGPPGSAAAEAVESGEDSAGAGVPAPETDLVAAQPQTALLPQTVEAGLQEGHRVEGHPGGTGQVNFRWCCVFPWWRVFLLQSNLVCLLLLAGHWENDTILLVVSLDEQPEGPLPIVRRGEPDKPRPPGRQKGRLR